MERATKRLTKKASLKVQSKTKSKLRPTRLKIEKPLKSKKLISKNKVILKKLVSEEYSFPILNQGDREKKTTYYILGVVTVILGCLFIVYAGLKNNILGPQHGVEVEIDARKPASIKESIAKEKENVSSIQLVKDISSYQFQKSEELNKQFLIVKDLSLNEKIKYWSNLLEKNYHFRKHLIQLSKKIILEDVEVLIPNSFGSTNYLETVIALSKSNTPQEIIQNILSLRYKENHPAFLYKNHFIEADWIPHNENLGNIKDITSQISKQLNLPVQMEQKEINRLKWYSKLKKNKQMLSLLKFPNSKEENPFLFNLWNHSKTVSISYIPLQEIITQLDKIPSGSILNLVHQSHQNHDTLVTAQGIIVKENDRLFIRRAMIRGKIQTTLLENYMNSLIRKQKRKKNWPLIGVNLNQIL